MRYNCLMLSKKPNEPILSLYRSKKGLNILVEALPCLKTDITEVQRIFPIN